MDPYGDFSDSTFLVFFAESQYAQDLLLGSTFFIGSVSTSNEVVEGAEAEIWLSTMNEKSYELSQYWMETLKEIPAIAQKVSWKPRYALWGCFSGSSFSEMCSGNPEYLSSCACGGEFCSPEKRTYPQTQSSTRPTPS